MKKIDTSDWRKFIIGNLFEPLETGFIGVGKKIGTATTAPDSIHVVPLTAAKNDNNGIMYWGRLGDYVTYSNVIAVIRDGAVSTGRIFAQEQETGTYSHSYFIRVKEREVSFPTNLFLSRILETVIYPRYTRDDACIWERIKYDEILLPVDSDGNPDWMYMDEYMQNILDEVEISIENLSRTDNRKHEINIFEWKEFVIGDLFDIHPTKAYKKINIELFEEDGTNPVVVNTGFNNGVGGYASLDCTEKAGTITFTDTAAKSTDSFFYQERDFIGYPHVQGMYAKTHEWTKNEGLFLNSVIKSLLRGQYDFIRKMTRAEMLKLKVKLPAVIEDGVWVPDWNYLESYMQNTIEIAEKMMNDFEKLSI